jgi:hypothetical protein
VVGTEKFTDRAKRSALARRKFLIFLGFQNLLSAAQHFSVSIIAKRISSGVPMRNLGECARISSPESSQRTLEVVHIKRFK